MSRRVKRARYALVIPLLIAIAWLSSGCVRMYDPEASQEQGQDVIATVRSGHPFEQTFTSRRPALDLVALQLVIAPDSDSQNGTLTFALYQAPGETTPIATRQLSFQKIASSNPLNISFPIQADSGGKSYYFTLTTSQGAVQVLGRAANVYPQGNATSGGQPLEGDASLRLYYDYGWRALLSDVGQMASSAGLLLPILLLLFLPGYLALDLLGLGRDFGGSERFALALGFSLAVIPLLMTWTSLLGLHWSSTALWFAAGVLSALALWRFRGSIYPFKLKVSWTGLALAGVLLVSLVVRFAMVRDLSAPPWVDSIHHGLITRLIMQAGGFPSSYAPVLDISSAQYHPGFHSLLASFLWLSELSLPEGMLVFGQVLNALAVVAVYLLAASLTGDRRAGLFAALITGVLTPMPAYYTSWGRYTQLTSLLILPAAFVWVKYLITYPPTPVLSREGGISLFPKGKGAGGLGRLWKPLLMAGITCGGLFLTHYRVVVFLACLILAYLVVHNLFERRLTLEAGSLAGTDPLPGTRPLPWTRPLPGTSRASLLQGFGFTLLAGLLALLLVLPWLVPTIQALVLPKLSQWKHSGPLAYNTFAWTYLTSGSGKLTLVLAGLGLAWALAWGILRKQWFGLTLALWTGLMFVFSNLDALSLPGGGFINNTSVQISLFMPVALLGGFFLSRLFELGLTLFKGKWQVAFSWVMAVACLGLAVYGGRVMLPLLNPTTFLYRQADEAAIQWIAANVAEGETVVVNPFLWGYGLYAGSDGGYWISALSGRKTLPPPVLYGLEDDPAQVKLTNTIIQQVMAQGFQPEALAGVMRQHGLHYVYIGAKGGLLSARLLQESALFELVFHGEATWVFRLSENS